MTHHLTLELNEQVYKALQQQAEKAGISISELAKTSLEEKYLQPQKRRQSGSAKGQIWMSSDFDQPLEDFIPYQA